MSEDRKLSALYHSADKPLPPTALDASIRAAARRAVKPKHSHAPQWLGGIAASLFAALLITQLLPTIEQEADISPTRQYDAPHPAMDDVAPERALKEEAEAEHARASKQQAPEKALARDEADAGFLSPVPLAEEARALAAPQFITTSPEMELKAITDLLDAGKTDEARQRLDDFRKHYPDVTIPDTLTQRLSK